MKIQSRYLDSIENAIKMSSPDSPSASFLNTYILRRIGLSERLINQIISFSSVVYLFLWIISFFKCIFDFLFAFVRSIFCYSSLRNNNIENEDIMLFFTELFWGRLKAAGIFEQSKYWIISPEIKAKDYDLGSKIIIDYKSYGSPQKCKQAFVLSMKIFKDLFHSKERLFIKMYNIFQYHFCQLCIMDIVKNNNIYFSNQSDRWALMFDRIPSKKKILCQHGIDSDKYEIPHKLKNIDVFYAISNISWQNSYYSNLDCNPELKLMHSTIKLSKLPTSEFSVLIISNLAEIDKESIVLDFLRDFHDVKILFKKHPTESINRYKSYQEKYAFSIVPDDCFPEANLVISYFSTLAYEYSAHQIPVYIYSESIDITMMKKIFFENYEIYKKSITR